MIPAGCIFSPHKDDGGGGGGGTTDYPKLINPTSVLDALSQAYGKKDSVEIALIYDINYQGTSFDPDVPGQIALTRQDEIRHVQTLYARPAVTVSLSFPPVRTRETDLSDPPGWTTIKIQNMNLQLSDAGTGFIYNILPAETWEFKFIPHAPDSTSPTDTTWKIVRWTELP